MRVNGVKRNMIRKSKRRLICHTVWCQPLSLILYLFLFPNIRNQSWIIGLRYLSLGFCLFSLIARDWRLQEGFSAIWFWWYCPYWRECVTVWGMYICTSLWLIIILCHYKLSDWEYFTPAEMMVVFSWGIKVIVCGVCVLQRWGNIQYVWV